MKRLALLETLTPGIAWFVVFDGQRETWTRRRSWAAGRSCQICWKAIPYGDAIAGPSDHRSPARVHVRCLEALDEAHRTA